MGIIKKQDINRFYLTICKGHVKDNIIDFSLSKIEGNKMIIDKEKGKESLTEIKNIIYNNNYSLIKIKLITGRTHQIRIHLKAIYHPVIGDIKYGDPEINRYFNTNYQLQNQLLHAYEIEFNGLEGHMSYLNNKVFTAPIPERFGKIAHGIFGGKFEDLFK